ncbi:MAG: hypothetical protein ACRD8O_08420 [Bryobacteraceae bacterium]
MRRILHPPKWLAVLVPALVALVGRARLLPELPVPTPLIHDEFSYLLAADTFASGRAANPTPPCWEYLEAEPGRHLVFVRYAPAQDYHRDGVYNRADVAAAKVVWAREIEEDEHSRLLQCYPGRRRWLLDPARYGQDGRPRFLSLD